ncbi:MAG: hypothetical protein K8U57_27550 [Planctomycetes bacterium]|nr:hypothetical protein [Planctomycetota bacterium]
MVPPDLASEAFKLFMVIPRERIEEDTAGGDVIDALVRYETARKQTVAFYETAEEDMTAERCAEFMHAEMVMGCLALTIPTIHPDVAFRLGGGGARGAAQTALFAAGKTGELGKLNEEMDRILAAAGIEDLHELDEDEWPEGYLPLAERAGELLGKIEKMMVIDILNRYGLHEQAELFEADEEAFDSRVREGYYLLFPEKREQE